MSLLNLLEEFVIFEKIRKMKNKKGFTLVELIVVLVILAILAALLVPALTGYIDKANRQKVVATTRQVVMAAQTEISEAYGKATLTGKTITIQDGQAANDGTADTDVKGADIVTLAEVGKYGTTYSLNNGISEITIVYGSNGHVTSVVVKQGKTCTYTEGATDGTDGAYNVA